MLLSSCRKEVVGLVEGQKIVPWRTGGILKYKISYSDNRVIDTTYLIGNRLYHKGTMEPFELLPGDSIQIKVGLFGTKFVRIHSLVKRKQLPNHPSNTLDLK